MKKVLIAFFLLLINLGNIAGQDMDVKNWISGEHGLTGIIGLNLRYERMLNEKISISALLTANVTAIMQYMDYSVQTALRWYPWEGKFYSELGLGFGHIYIYHDHDPVDDMCTISNILGIRLSPAIGWKFDLGKPGGFFLNPMVRMPIVVGTKIYAE